MIKKIIVYTYGKDSHANTIDAAAQFAVNHGAELTGFFVRPDIINYSTVYGEYPLALAQTFFDMQDECAAIAKKEFEKVTEQYDCKTSWYEIDEYEKVPKPYLYADFLFVSQPSIDSSVVFNDTDFLDHLVVDTGLPIIVIPSDWSAESFANRPALGWKETREAVGAVRHALPLMRAAKSVDVVTVKAKSDRDSDLVQGIEICEFLTEHEVTCKFFVAPKKREDKNESTALMQHAYENNCDLIIIGGYGHSRFREIVLGGVTRGLLRNSKVPLLLSH